MSKQKAKLEKWSVVSYGVNPYQAPEQAATCLAGFVYDHPKQPNGKQVLTSPVKMISYRNRVAITNNTTYELGDPDPDFVEWLTRNGIKIEQYELGLEN